MVKEGDKNTLLVSELPDEALDSAMGGGESLDPGPDFRYGGECRNCSWRRFFSTLAEARAQIKLHEDVNGHSVGLLEYVGP